MNLELTALVSEIRRLVSTLESTERRKEREKTLEGDAFIQVWEESKPIIRQNFEAWRDYLYKYALILISILGFITTLIATKWIGQLSIGLVVFGIVCIGLAALKSFVSIFITLYLERKFVAADMAFTQCMHVGFHKADGQDDGTRSPMRAIEKYLGEAIITREAELAGLKEGLNVEGLTDLDIEKQNWKIADLTKGINGDRRTKALMKYVGIQYTSYETARLIITIIIVSLSLIGLSAVIYTLLSSYAEVSTVSKTEEHYITAPPSRP